MFVAISRFAVKNGMEEQVRKAFQERPHLVDDTPGFVRMEVLRPAERPQEFWLMTWWRDEPSFRAWHKGHTFSASHHKIPKGLKLIPTDTKLEFFEHIAS